MDNDLAVAVGMVEKLVGHMKIEVTFPDFNVTAEDLIDCLSFRTLCQIRDILRDEDLSDAECFGKIEEIVNALEKRGFDCWARHDFG